MQRVPPNFVARVAAGCATCCSRWNRRSPCCSWSARSCWRAASRGSPTSMPGTRADGVLAAELYVPGGDTPDQAARIGTLVSALLDRVRAIPGIESAGAGNMMPLDRATMIAGFPAPWAKPGAELVSARALQYVITPGYQE